MEDQDIMAVMERFGVGPHDFVRAQACPETLAEFQIRMRQRYRSMVKDLHPDTGGDPALFRAATAVINDVMQMQIRDSYSRRRMKWAVQIRVET